MYGNRNEEEKKKAALHDFITRSLGPLSNAWEKLVYVSGLRKKPEPYAHWGMEDSYGKKAAGAAIEEAHRHIVKEMLATPYERTLEAVEGFAAQNAQPAQDAIDLVSGEKDCGPPELSKPEAKHLQVELEALRLLTKK